MEAWIRQNPLPLKPTRLEIKIGWLGTKDVTKAIASKYIRVKNYLKVIHKGSVEGPFFFGH